MDGVGGSDNTPEGVETGKVNPELLSEEFFHLESSLSMEMLDKTGLADEETDGGFVWRFGNKEEAIFVTFCQILSFSISYMLS